MKIPPEVSPKLARLYEKIARIKQEVGMIKIKPEEPLDEFNSFLVKAPKVKEIKKARKKKVPKRPAKISQKAFEYIEKKLKK